jgi:hypothetical protein
MENKMTVTERNDFPFGIISFKMLSLLLVVLHPPSFFHFRTAQSFPISKSAPGFGHAV